MSWSLAIPLIIFAAAIGYSYGVRETRLQIERLLRELENRSGGDAL